MTAAWAFHVLAKPAGSACNLGCSYCYYKDKPNSAAMSPAVLDEFIRQYIHASPAESVVFTWHGGEPTLLGLDYFRQIVSLQQKHKRAGQRIENDLQTNGLLLDDDWCAFLKEHGFLVGLSIDGPANLHDTHRRTHSGQGSHADVLAAAGRLVRHGVSFNAMAVVNRQTASRPLEIYRFLAHELNARFIQFLPCVEPKAFADTPPQHWPTPDPPTLHTTAARPGEADSFVTDWSVDPTRWGRFLCEVFDDWLAHDVGVVAVNWFESLMAQWAGRPAQMCVLSPTCGRAMAIEADGSVYPCDHYVYPATKLGNIVQTAMEQLVQSPAQVAFGRSKYAALTEMCQACPYLFACNGECPRNRFVRTPSGQAGHNYLCPGLRTFFTHADGALRRLARERK